MFRIFFSPRIAPQLATTGCELHLVKPLGIDLSEPKPRRAGLDYHDLTFVIVHPKLDATWAVPTPKPVFALTDYAGRSFADTEYRSARCRAVWPRADGPGRVKPRYQGPRLRR